MFCLIKVLADHDMEYLPQYHNAKKANTSQAAKEQRVDAISTLEGNRSQEF
jgi:hypothetical protein